MYFVKLVVFLFSCYSTEGFLFNRNGNRFRKIHKIALIDTPEIQTQWMEQQLDQFNKTDERTWKMKYFQRLDMWKPNGPIYLIIGGESKASKGELQYGFEVQLANQTNGAMFSSEHRYYGDSKPFQNLTSENLKFLSSRQSLADNAMLLKKIKSAPEFRSSKVVVIGGSYPGNLAAWMRLLYPDLVDAAIAASAPVLAKADFFEYFETVSDDFKRYGTPGCYDKVRYIFNRYNELLKTDDGIEMLKKEENICSKTDLSKRVNQEVFFLDKVSSFQDIAQYGNINDIKSTCKDILNSSQVVSSKGDMSLWNEKRQCFHHDFKTMVKGIKKSDMMTSWMYQTCTEFGYYQTSNSKHHPFTDNIHLELFFDMCTAIYGPEFDKKRVDEGVLKSNEMYGGLSPNVTNVIFINGELDPWRRLSVVKDISDDVPARVIPLTSHCTVLMPDASGDPEELREVRKYVKSLVKKWINAS